MATFKNKPPSHWVGVSLCNLVQIHVTDHSYGAMNLCIVCKGGTNSTKASLLRSFPKEKVILLDMVLTKEPQIFVLSIS